MMPLAPRELNEMLGDLPPSMAAEIREFASRDVQSQNVYLYRELKQTQQAVDELKNRRTALDRLMDYGNAAALVAYILFAQKDNLFPRQ